MAITNAKEYEAALEEAIRLLDTPPGHEVSEPRLMQLFQEIEAYRPTFSASAASHGEALSARATELVLQATRLKRRWDEREPSRWTSFPSDGHGIGPTTGV
jgi:hypothetical protein